MGLKGLYRRANWLPWQPHQHHVTTPTRQNKQGALGSEMPSGSRPFGSDPRTLFIMAAMHGREHQKSGFLTHSAVFDSLTFAVGWFQQTLYPQNDKHLWNVELPPFACAHTAPPTNRLSCSHCIEESQGRQHRPTLNLKHHLLQRERSKTCVAVFPGTRQ